MGEDEELVCSGPQAFRERVSDSILGHRDWVYLSEGEKSGLPAQAWAGVSPVPDPAAFEAKRHRLSFYGGETLLELCGIGDSLLGPRYFLESSGEVDQLVDGSTYVLPQEYNPTMKLHLTLDNALDYLRFYFFFVHQQHGPVFLLDNLDHPAVDHDRLDEFFALEVEEELEPPVLRADFSHWDFACDVFILYCDCVFQTTFFLEHGVVDGTPLFLVAEGLPVRRLKADYRLGARSLPKVYPRGVWGGRPMRSLK